MTISRVGAATGTTTCTVPTHSIGDLILIGAFRQTTATSPSLPAGYTSIANGTATSCAYRCGYKIATATNDSSGTWTNATAITCVVYTSDQIAAGGAINIGGHLGSSAATNPVSYGGITLNYTDGASWVFAFSGNRSPTNSVQTHPPTGMTLIASSDLVNTVEVCAFDTNAGVSSWSTQTTTLSTATGWGTTVVEIFETNYASAIINSVQHRSTSYNNVAAVNEPLENFAVALPDATQSGQGLVCAVAYPSGATPSITDDQGNTWPASGAAGTVTADAGGGAMAIQIFRLASAAANTRIVTVGFGGSPQQPVKVWLEKLYNITGTVNGSKTGTSLNTLGTVSPGSFTPTNNNANGGNLILAYMVAQGTSNSTNPTDIAPARGYFLQDADIGWVSGNGIPSASQAFLQTTAAATTPMFTLQGSGTDTYIVAAIALSVGTQGSDDSRTNGHIDRIIEYATNTAGSPWKNKTPMSGTTGLIIGFVAGTPTNNTVTSDNGTNTWTTIEGAAGSPYFNYFQGLTASSSREVSQTFTGSGNGQFVFYDLSNLDTGTAPVTAGVGSTAANNVASIANQPSITPSSANGVAFGNLQNGLGPTNGITSPSGALFDCPLYQTGQFTFTQSGTTANVSAVAWGQVYGDGITGVTGSGVANGQSNQSATSSSTGNRTFNISQTLGTTTGHTTSTDSSSVNWGEGLAHVFTTSTAALNFTWNIASQPASSVSSTAIWFKAAASTTNWQGAANFTGAGAFTANAQLIEASQATFAGAGLFTANATAQFAAQATFGGAGSFTATATMQFAAQATFAGAGSFTATGLPVDFGFANFAGAGSFTANAGPAVLAAAANFGGAGLFTANAQLIEAAQATFAGAGSFTANATALFAAQATFAGTGAFTANATTQIAGQQGAANFNGAGLFTANASQPQRSAAANFAGAGLFTANATVQMAAQATFAGTGGFTATAALRMQATASFAGAGAFTANGNVPQHIAAQATFAGAGSFTANATTQGVTTWTGAAAFAGSGTFIASATVLSAALPVPNGRWRPVFDTSYVHTVIAGPPPQFLTPSLRETGFTLYFISPAAGDLPAGAVLILTRPDGSTIRVPAARFYTGINDPTFSIYLTQGTYAAYVTSTDLNQQGTWSIEIKDAANNNISGIGFFSVAA